MPPNGGPFIPWNINIDPFLIIQRGNTQDKSYHFEPLIATSKVSTIVLKDMYLKWWENETKYEAPNQVKTP